MLKKNDSQIFCIVSLFFLFSVGLLNFAFAGITGKIYGRVVDAQTNQPIAGANIILEGTVQGAATDINGNYFIINVKPGPYTVMCNVIGYATVHKTDLYVSADLSIKVDFALQVEAVKGEEVTVVGERPIIHPDVAGAEMVMREEDVEVFSQDLFQDFMENQVGIYISAESEGTGLSIRGGDINETDILVNGVSLRNALTQQPNLGISLTSIKEVTITTGGFTAEHGDIRSGLVNVITKEGSRDHYSLSLDARFGPPQKKHFGPNPYSVEGPIWNVYCGDKAYEGDTAGDVAGGYFAFEFMGWDQWALQHMNDGVPGNDYTPQQWMEIWRWKHRNIEYATKPDYIVDGSLSGPFLFKNSTFLFSQHYENLQLVFPYSRKNSIQSSTQANLTLRITPQIKATFTNLFILEQGVAARGQTYNTGIVTGTKQGTSLADGHRWQMLFNPYGVNPINKGTYFSGIKLKHSLSPKTYYNLSITGSYYQADQEVKTHRDTTKSYQIGNVWLDETPSGYFEQRNQYDMFDQFWINGGGGGLDSSTYWQVRVKGFIESQVNFRNLVKVGFEAAYSQYHMAAAKVQMDKVMAGDYQPPHFLEGSVPLSTFFFDNHPLQIAAYIQDKLEYEGMIANLGIRFDIFNPMRSAWKIEDWNSGYTMSEWRRIEVDTTIISDTQMRLDTNYVNIGFRDQLEGRNAITYRFSPRLGISFPATSTSKFFFNYGHFYQLPIAEQLFNVDLDGGSPPFKIPNLTAAWPKTVMYEVGFEKAFAEKYLFRITSYYKDVTNQLSQQSFYDFYKNEMYATMKNNEYEDIRGLELRIQKRYGKYGYGWVDFEYISTNEGRTGLKARHQNWQYKQEQRENVEQEKNWPVPRISAIYSFLLPDDFGPAVLGFKPLANWALQINAWWRAGGKRIFDSSAPVWNRHYIQRIDRHNIDMVLRKGFNIWRADISIYMRIRNLTDFKGPIRPYSGNEYRSSLHLPWLQGELKGNDKYGEGPSDEKPYIDAGWHTWRQYYNPRHIMVGVDVNL